MNPFLTTGYIAPEYFCNREKEAATLKEAVLGGRNVMLFSIRRLGKSALIDHMGHTLPKKLKAHVIHVDLLATQNARDFANVLVNAVTRFRRVKHPLKSLADSIFQSVTRSRVVFSTDLVTGLPEVSLEPGDWGSVRKTVEAVLSELAKSPYQIVIALDEFQQVTNYPEKDILAEVRSLTQTFPTLRFIFSGSEETLLTHIFTHPKQPFYKSSQLMHLKRIPMDEYYRFAKKHFGKTTLGEKEFVWIYDWCHGITFHVQWFCNRLDDGGYKAIDRKALEETALRILGDFTFQFNSYQRLLTMDQFALLTAIGRETRVYKPTSVQFISTHKLKLATHVQRSLKALLAKGLVQEDFDDKNARFYFISDAFLSRWLQRL